MCKKEKVGKSEEDGECGGRPGRGWGGVEWGSLDRSHPTGDIQPETEREQGTVSRCLEEEHSLQTEPVGQSTLPLVFGWPTRLRMFLTFFNGWKKIKRRVVFHDT